MDLRVHLKVCEGCGRLWFRAQNHRGVYCLGCNEKLKQFPSAQSRRRPGPRRDTTLVRIWAVAENSISGDLFVGEAAGGAE